MDAMKQKRYRWGFIKLEENQAYYDFELEVVGSEDCTNNLEELIGNINMMDTKFGNLTGATPHLMKEKSEIMEEARKFHRQTTVMNNQAQMQNFEAGLENYSMIQPQQPHNMFMRKGSMAKLGNYSAIHAPMQASPFPNYNNTSMYNNNTMGNVPPMHNMRTSAHPGHFRMSSNIQPSNLVQSMNFIPDNPKAPQMYNPSLNKTYNLGNTSNLVKSTVFHEGNPRLSMIRRPTIMDKRTNLRQSVLQTYKKLATMHQERGHNMSQSQLDSSAHLKNVSIYTDNRSHMSNSRM